MIEYLQEFLEKPAIGDGWGKNQSGRLEWISAMRKRYGNDFSDLYHIQDNQFRGNVLAFARVALDHLLTSIRDNGQTALATNLEQILREIKESYKNSHYNEQESLQEKLKLVHLFEDKIIEALQLLTGSSSTMGHAG
jgi:hypothetical protein